MTSPLLVQNLRLLDGLPIGRGHHKLFIMGIFEQVPTMMCRGRKFMTKTLSRRQEKRKQA